MRKAVLIRILYMLTASLLLCPSAEPLSAHEVRPAYLQLCQQSEDVFDAMWKVPALGDMRLGIYLQLPEEVENIIEPRAYIAGGAYVERWTFRHGESLIGDTIRIQGLDRTMIDVLVRIERLDGSTQVERVEPSRPWFIVTASPTRAHLAWIYLVIGIEHIIFGIDHLLFVFALLLIVKGVAKLVKTITAFTVAHSITLALASLGLVHVPGPPVEAIIALSIAFVAMELVRGRQGRPGITARWPWIVAFTFGLLHGFGFAGALSEVGLPEQAIPLALLFFNVGVEVGQLMFVGVILLLSSVVSRMKITLPNWIEAIPAYAIGSVAMFWTIERVAGFF